MAVAVVTERVPGETTSPDAAESAVCAVVRGIADVWRDVADPSAQAAFLAAARRHRLQPLLSWLLRQCGELGSWPASIRQPLLESERAEAALEIVRRAELARMLRAFSAAGIEVVLFKGAAFAYGLYPEPWLRPREDTDVIVRLPAAAAVGAALADAGFRPLPM